MTSPPPATGKTGASVVGVGVAACAACCAAPLFGLVTALVAGASAVALATGAILLALIVAATGAGFIAWRRHRAAPTSCASDAPTPVTLSTRPGR